MEVAFATRPSLGALVYQGLSVNASPDQTLTGGPGRGRASQVLEVTMRGLSVISLALVFLAGCSDSDEDPLAAKCESSCAIEKTHPCYKEGKGKEECVQKCRELIGTVDKDPQYMKGCAECLAGYYSYSVKPGCTGGSECCWGILQPQLGDSNSEGWVACEAKCIEPDGGIGY
jgi:hypothetical protein